MAEVGNIAAVILAAGRSTRMGANKLLADLGGKPLVRFAVEAALGSAASPVLAVTGHQAGKVRRALAGLHVGFVHNREYAEGMATSLKAGLGALPPAVAGALVLLGDMPQITPVHLDRLIVAFRDQGGAIIVPTHAGRRGNPVLWPRAFFAPMRRLGGDAGAKGLLTAHASRVCEVDLGTDAIFLDVDTAEALAQMRARAPRA